jgi:hypothetical protein
MLLLQRRPRTNSNLTERDRPALKAKCPRGAVVDARAATGIEHADESAPFGSRLSSSPVRRFVQPRCRSRVLTGGLGSDQRKQRCCYGRGRSAYRVIHRGHSGSRKVPRRAAVQYQRPPFLPVAVARANDSQDWWQDAPAPRAGSSITIKSNSFGAKKDCGCRSGTDANATKPPPHHRW